MSSPLVVFRVDASLEMGSGHIMRCLALADALTNHEFQCLFITREHSGHMASVIEGRGYEVKLLALQTQGDAPQEYPVLSHAHWLGGSQVQDADLTLQIILPLEPVCVVVDHYALDYRWERLIRSATSVVFAIDDLADRRHDCSLLLDQTFGRHSRDYSALVDSSTTCLCGAEYALLRSKFHSVRARTLEERIKREPQRILVSMGGVDKDNVTCRVLHALSLSSILSSFEIVVVMGANAPWLEQVKSFAATMPVATNVLVNVDDMAELMSASDIAVGAAGSTSWERCCLGLPTLMVVLADNQRYAASLLQAARAVEMVSLEESFEDELVAKVERLILNSTHRKKMIVDAAAITEGRGGELVSREIKRLWRQANE